MKKLQGVYLVIDPKQNWEQLLEKLEAALKGGIQIVQIWDHWQTDVTKSDKLRFAEAVKRLASVRSVPVLMHDDWMFAKEANLDGVHFDNAPDNIEEVRQALANCYIGITVGNDRSLIEWAEANALSYISFCAVFPSPSVDSCEIVDQQVIKETKNVTDMPVFLSGGITISNLQKLAELSFDGVAVISGVLSAENPEQAVRDYVSELEKLKTVS
ncbi:MAG: thiamine phosphate synthase [Bacteroidota bacterium]